jgi:hypothetical protein
VHVKKPKKKKKSKLKTKNGKAKEQSADASVGHIDSNSNDRLTVRVDLPDAWASGGKCQAKSKDTADPL